MHWLAAIAFDLAAIQGKRPPSYLNFPDMIHMKKKIPKRKNCQATCGQSVIAVRFFIVLSLSLPILFVIIVVFIFQSQVKNI